MKSEFGKGFIICLIKFAEHIERSNFHNEDDDYKKKMIEIYETEEKYMSHKIEMWFNAASDHLYEIEVPKGKDWNRIRTKVNELQKKSLNIGHGFNKDAKWTYNDYIEMRDLTREIALMIDRKLGIKPQVGEF